MKFTTKLFRGVKMRPWKNWIPGVLSEGQLEILCEEKYISGVQDFEKSIDHSSIDLTLSEEGYQMLRGSVKPFKDRYHQLLTEKLQLSKRLKIGTDDTFTLQAKSTYLFKLRERLHGFQDSYMYGQATTKSSIGRMDVLARLVVDGMDAYDYFDPEGIKKGGGDLYLEITPITFNVRVQPGIPLTQLRLFYGNPNNVEMKGRELCENVLFDSEDCDGSLSVDLSNISISGADVAAFYANAMEPSEAPLDLWEHPEEKKPDPRKYWKFMKSDDSARLTITKGEFYIFRSKEKIALPPGIAVYCRAMDETIGEMRIHYAGFVHPFFGKDRKDGLSGTPLIFEVRGHDVNVSLVHGEKMARLIFYRMSEDAKKNPATKSTTGKDYNEQTLKLSSFFAKWPDKVKVKEDGSVEAG